MNKKLVLIILFFIIVLSLAAVFLPKNYNSENMFTIKSGEGSKEISVNLEKAGLIWWGPAFRMYALLSGDQGKLQAGSYRLTSPMNIPAIVRKFVLGDIATVKITFPEGFDAEQIYQSLAGIAAEVSPSDLKEHEGYLFPDTYELPYDMELEKIIGIMTDNFNKKTAELEITPEVVIMASLLEKEVQTKEDR